MSSTETVKQKFIVKLKGKEFITYNGLLDLAHQIGIKSIETEILQLPNQDNNMTAVAKAIITTTDEKVFEEYGDAAPTSVNSMIAPHIIRMALTRAKARALRDLTNIGMTAIEELMDEEESNDKSTATNNKATDKQLNFIVKLAETKNVINNMPDILKDKYNVEFSKELSKQQASELCQYLQSL